MKMNKKAFFQEIKRSIFNRNMLAGLVFGSAILLYEILKIEGYFQYYIFGGLKADALSIISNVFSLSVFTEIAGALPGIGYGYSFLSEKNSGFIRFQLIRQSASEYINKKIIFTGITGVLMMGIPYSIIAVMAEIAGEPTTPAEHPEQMETLVWGKVLYSNDGFTVVLLKGILIILFGLMWSELSLLCTLFINNRYVSFVVPYVFYELLFFLDWRDGFLNTVNPRYMIRYDVGYDNSIWKPFICFIIYISVIILLTKLIFNRQVKNGKY